MLENISRITEFLSFSDIILVLILLQVSFVAKKIGSLNYKFMQLMLRGNIKHPSTDEDMSDP